MENLKFDIDLLDSNLAFWKNGNIDLLTQKVPMFTDIVFKEKWHSIFYRYESARKFLMFASNPGYDGLYRLENDVADEDRKYIDFNTQVDFYEAALVFYNALIDYSWQIAYLSFEFVCYMEDHALNLEEPIGKPTAKAIFSKLEKNVSSPTDEQSPLHYFSKYCNDGKYKDVINFIGVFWKKFSTTNVRKKYNHIKHCGNYLYKESYEFTKMPFIMHIEKEGKELPSDTRDIQEAISLKESIKELYDFDNNDLLNYLSELIEKLKKIIDPSKLVF